MQLLDAEEFLPLDLPATLILEDQNQYPAQLVQLGLEEALLTIRSRSEAALSSGALLKLSLRLPQEAGGLDLCIPAQIESHKTDADSCLLRIAFNIPEQDDLRVLNDWALAGRCRESDVIPLGFDPRRAGQIFNQCRQSLAGYLRQSLPGLPVGAREILQNRDRQAGDDAGQARLFDSLQEITQLCHGVDREFLAGMENRLDAFVLDQPLAQTIEAEPADELSLVDTASFNDWLLTVQIIARVQKKIAATEQQLTARIGLLLARTLVPDQIPFGVCGLCSQYHEAMSHFGATMGARRALLAAFEKILLKGIEEFYQQLNDLLEVAGVQVPRPGATLQVRARSKNTAPAVQAPEPTPAERAGSASEAGTAGRQAVASGGTAHAVLQLLSADPLEPAPGQTGAQAGSRLSQLVQELLAGLLADPLVGESAGLLIQRLAPAFEHTVQAGDLFFADEHHPARVLIDCLPCAYLNADQRDLECLEKAAQEILDADPLTRDSYAAALDALAPLLATHEQNLACAREEIAERYSGQQQAVAALHGAEAAANEATPSATSRVLQPWLAQADEQLCGDQLIYESPADQPGCPATLAWKSPDGQTFVWLLHRQFKPLCLTRQELAMELRGGRLRLLEAQDEGLCERVLCRRLYNLHERVQENAIHDPVTGLVKRRHFEQEIRAALQRAGSRFDPDYLALAQIDGYHDLAQRHGQSVINKLMGKLAQVLNRQLREAGLACRINESCFGILINVGDRDAALGYMQRFRRAVREARCIFKGQPFSITISLGLIAIEEQLVNVAGTLDYASQYQQRAWRAGGNRLCSPLLEDPEARLDTEIRAGDPDVRELLHSGRLALRAQRVQAISAAAGDRPYYEILLGVRESDGRLSPPGSIITAAEKSGFITELDRWVIRTALEWMGGAPERLERVSGYAMNLSGISLCDPALLKDVLGYIKAAPVAPEKLIFEVTETAGIERLSVAQGFAKTVRELGCGLSLDDFGSGHASFSYLKTLPVDKIKIDGMFVREITSNPDDYAVVRSINEIAHAMDRMTVAEFVEDEESLAVLRRLGVDYVQGYGIEKPVPIDEIPLLKPIAEAAA